MGCGVILGGAWGRLVLVVVFCLVFFVVVVVVWGLVWVFWGEGVVFLLFVF